MAKKKPQNNLLTRLMSRKFLVVVFVLLLIAIDAKWNIFGFAPADKASLVALVLGYLTAEGAVDIKKLEEDK